jgi:hypothetical protein
MQATGDARSKVNMGEIIDDDSLADAKGQTRPLDCLWTINQRKVEYEAKVARIFVSKHRFGEGRFEFHIETDRERTLEMREISKAEFDRRVNVISANKEVSSRDDEALKILAEEQRKKYASKKLKNDPGKAMEE